MNTSIEALMKAAQSVPVVGEPVAWVNINKHGDITRTVRRRDNWCTTPVFAKPTTSIPAAELASLREKVAQFDSADMEYLLGCKAAYQQELETRTKFQHELNALEQERDELRKDAARYQFIRALENDEVAVQLVKSECDVELDEAIDAAIAQGKGE